MADVAFDLKIPALGRGGVVFSSPHSGRAYGAEFLKQSVLDPLALRSSEDAFVDVLFEQAVDFGASFLAARAPRAFVDLNRAVEELDPAVVHGAKPRQQNPRVASGLGVIPRVVAHGQAIYCGKISLADAHARLDQVWRPYHAQLQDLLDQARASTGQAILIDCHSMPHAAVAPVSHRGDVPQIVLGDRFGASADCDITDYIAGVFQAAGFTVARNSPFAGAYVAQHYGRPSRGQHVVQVEVDRSLYMDEASVTPGANFSAFKARLRPVIRDIARLGQGAVRVAAE